MSSVYGKRVPRLDNIGKQMSQEELVTYFLTKIVAYSRKVVGPVMKLIEMTRLTGSTLKHVNNHGSQFRVEGCLYSAF